MKEKWSNITVVLKHVLAPAALLITLAALAAFADSQQSGQKCREVKINILDREDYSFISEKGILNTVTRNGTVTLAGKKTADIELEKIEKLIRENPFVKQVQAHFDMSGRLVVRLRQRIPVVRVINPALQAYYIDEEGKRMPLSTSYAAHVPLATPSYFAVPGKKEVVLKELDSSIFVLAAYIQNDSFARALTGQILLQPDNEFALVPRLGNFTIFIGDASGLDDKFTRLKSFYRVSLPQAGWNRYASLSLKYKNQIVATH